MIPNRAYRRYRVQFSTFIAVFLCAIVFAGMNAHAKANDKYGAIVLDVSTGTVLYEDRADKKLHPASLTKMMTLLMTFDALRAGDITLKSKITVSQHAANMVPSKLGLNPGASIRVEDAILSLVTKSANDIAVTLAENLGKSESNFARMMTKRARELGMRSTVFRNASGLHDPAQITTPRDIAILSLALIMDYPEYYHFFSKRSFTYQGNTYGNHNKLLGSYDGMDGLKTGYIQASGFNLAASAVQDGRRLIGVVFGGNTSASRNAEMVRLLDNGFMKVKSLKVLVAENVPVPPEKPIYVASTGDIYAKPLHLKFKQPANDNSKQYVDDPLDISVKETVSRWAMLNPEANESLFRRMIGEGDYDDAVRSRIATGLIAISAITGADVPENTSFEEKVPASIAPSRVTKKKPEYVVIDRNWGIQVGAFSSRDSANQAIALAVQKLPASLRQVTAAIAPRKVDDSWVFRGRLSGYSKEEAQKACGLLDDCLIVPPKIYNN